MNVAMYIFPPCQFFKLELKKNLCKKKKKKVPIKRKTEGRGECDLNSNVIMYFFFKNYDVKNVGENVRLQNVISTVISNYYVPSSTHAEVSAR